MGMYTAFHFRGRIEEIQKFCDWVKPYVYEAAAYMWYEEDEKPEFLITKLENDDEL